MAGFCVRGAGCFWSAVHRYVSAFLSDAFQNFTRQHIACPAELDGLPARAIYGTAAGRFRKRRLREAKASVGRARSLCGSIAAMRIQPSIWALIVLRFIQGMAGGAGIVISRAVVRDLYSGPELTKFFTLLMLVNGTAPILAPIAGGQILRITSWPGVFFLLLAAVGVVMLLIVFFRFA